MCVKVLFFLVIAVVFVKIEARPDNIIKRDLTDNRLDNQELDDLTFKFPKEIKEGVVITIKGILNANHETFHALLPSSTDGDNCQIVYHFKKHTLEVMPASSSEFEPSTYSVEINPTEPNTFTLKLKARFANGTPIFDFTFEGNDHLKTGPSNILPCKIKSFEDISYIVMKEGVERVTSLLFEFPK